jgi:hypothetical protein
MLSLIEPSVEYVGLFLVMCFVGLRVECIIIFLTEKCVPYHVFSQFVSLLALQLVLGN